MSSGSGLSRHFGGCVATILVFAALTVMTQRVIGSLAPDGLRWTLILLSSLFLSSGVLGFWGLASGKVRQRSFEAVLRRARAGEAPPDGESAIATGHVRALGPILEAPLSGTPCVSYEYSMSYNTDEGVQPVYWGMAARPFALDSSAARVRVLGVPRLEDLKRKRGEDAAPRARQFVANTPFERVSLAGTIGTLMGGYTGRVFTGDNDGFRHDYQPADGNYDPGTLILEEAVLPVRHLASVYGTWSAELAGITGHSSGSGSIGITVVLDPPEGLKGKAGLQSFVGSFVRVCVLAALGAGVLWLGTYLRSR